MDNPVTPLQASVLLSSGYTMPTIAMGGFFGVPDDVFHKLARAKQMMRDAIDVGYRHMDTAWAYRTEGVIGEAVREKINEGVITREDMFITTKLSSIHHDPAYVMCCLKESLKMLGMDYLDLYLIHSPVACQQKAPDLFPTYADFKNFDNTNDHISTWKAMEECVRAGLCRSIGVSNFNAEQISNIVENCEIKPAVNQVELHPYLAQQALVDHCRSLGIIPMAYGALGQGFPHRAAALSNTALSDPVIQQIASKHNRTAAQIALRYQLQRGVGVVVKSSRKEKLMENLKATDFSLDIKDMEDMAKMDKNTRLGAVPAWKCHKDCPY